MNRELIKRLSSYSEVFEDTNINGYKIPLLCKGMNGIFVCVEDIMDDKSCVELHNEIKRYFKLKNGQLFMFKMSEGVKGSLYFGKNVFVSEKNIYETFETCYAFTLKALLGERMVMTAC